MVLDTQMGVSIVGRDDLLCQILAVVFAKSHKTTDTLTRMMMMRHGGLLMVMQLLLLLMMVGLMVVVIQ